MVFHSLIRTFAPMKRNVLAYLLLLVLLLTACGQWQRYGIRQQLLLADSLTEHHPDSAYNMLYSMADDVQEYGDSEIVAHYTLLQTIASYKLYKPIVSDSAILACESYFRHHAEQHRLCQSLYYHGMIIYEQGHRQEAINILKEGELLAEALSDDSLRSKYYESLFQVNYESRCYDLSLPYGKKFLEHSLYINNVDYISRALSHLSSAFTFLGQKDSSYYYIMQTIPLLEKTNQEDRAYILANMGWEYMTHGEYEKAENVLKKSLELKELSNAYSSLGDVYWKTGRRDEALTLWNKALNNAKGWTRVSTLLAIQKVYLKERDYEKALQLSQEAFRLQDSIYKSVQSSEIAELQLKYDKTVAEEQLYKRTTYALIAIIIISILTGIIVYYFRRRIQKFKNQIADVMDLIRLKEARITALEEAGELSDEQRRALQAEIDALHQSASERIARGISVYNAIQEGKQLSANPQDEKCLLEYFSLVHYDTYKQWTSHYKDLSPRLLTYLILQHMGKGDDEIARLLNIEHNSVRSIKSRIKAKKTE